MEKKEKKQKALEWGAFAEEQASQEYLRRGYTVHEKRWRMGKSEIDLIVQKDSVIVFVEVKARKTNEEDALNAVTVDKKKRMIRVADNFIRRQQGQYFYRFDIVTCVGDKDNFKLEIYEDCFLATDLF